MLKKQSLFSSIFLLIFNSCQNKSEEAKSATNDIVFKDKAGHMITKNRIRKYNRKNRL
jgi:hypothetical protein